jgi:CelD/BcsL family acetyltransferase involved in cellulose biosynthesis
LINDFEQAATVWRQFDCPDRTKTPYQRLEFLAAWQRTVGASLGLTPCIVIAYNEFDGPVALLPLVIERASGVSIASFPGGKHVTFNMPLWKRDFAATATVETMQEFKRLIAASRAGIDVLALLRQPQSWGGIPNPLALLATQASINECPLLCFEASAAPAERISNSFRRRLKNKERKLSANPGYRYTIARSPDDVKRLLDAFFAIKTVRLAAQGLPNIFAEPGNEQFLRDAALTGLSDDQPAIEIHALECDDEVIALFAGVADRHRFSMMFNTYTLSANAKFSPGLVLIRNIVDHFAARGVTSLDLGIGADDYKLLFCREREPLFDGFVPLTTRGRAVATWLSLEARAKRWIKQSPRLSRIAMGLRRMART